MKRKFGTILMVMGTSLILAAMSLFLYNQYDSTRAEQNAAVVMDRLMEQVPPPRENTQPTAPALELPEALVDPAVYEMTVVEIDGHGYIGYLSVPELGLELPVMADWSYPKLKIAPCRYSGTVGGRDLVLMAHNYARHFGRLSELHEGADVIFTDMDGAVTYYEVVGLDILAPTAVDEMTAGDFDLTLFTCTYGGQSRVTVYCDRIKNG